MGVSIYTGDSPVTIDVTSPAARVKGGNCAEISGLDPDIRHYFRVVPEEDPGIMAAERRVPLDGAVNFRDLGGYQTSDGRRVKWGKVFRSDSLARLTDSDQALLMRMGIKLVCDFRTQAEVNMAPDRLPEDGSLDYIHLPVTCGEFDTVAVMERMKNGDISWFSKDFMINGYKDNIDLFADKWGLVLKRLAEPDSQPLVFHCTGGKDRAGACAALILLALGVPEETVIYDHGLSNVFIANLVNKVYEYIKSLGIDPEIVAPYFAATRDCMMTLLDHIRQNYTSPANYLRTKAGVSDETLEMLRQQLLV
jgi:protein-tyrosine phosphatase